jgi:ABC-2 type transport system ATP-binding protein
MIEIHQLSKQFGDKVAVNNISLKIPDNKVVGFLGPNGAGKSTTMNMILSLENPTTGTIKIDGQHYSDLEEPMKTVGAMVGQNFHKSRSPRAHLEFLAAAGGVPRERVEEVLKLTGLLKVADKPVGQFSLGMTQRAGLAAAILGKPKYLILDEPVNGLDPEGVIWVREFCKSYVRAGNSVFISSHLMSEVENTVDEAIVIARGKIIFNGTIPEIRQKTKTRNLEEAFIKLTSNKVDYKSGGLPTFNDSEGEK